MHPAQRASIERANTLGRWPANIIHDGSDEVVELFPAAPGQQGPTTAGTGRKTNAIYGAMNHDGIVRAPRADATGSAARFFYCAKASRSERGEGNTHPTVKPLALMRYLLRLVTPPGGRVLDPFAGSGSTLIAAAQEGFSCAGIDLEEGHVAIARARLAAAGFPLGWNLETWR